MKTKIFIAVSIILFSGLTQSPKSQEATKETTEVKVEIKLPKALKDSIDLNKRLRDQTVDSASLGVVDLKKEFSKSKNLENQLNRWLHYINRKLDRNIDKLKPKKDSANFETPPIIPDSTTQPEPPKKRFRIFRKRP